MGDPSRSSRSQHARGSLAAAWLAVTLVLCWSGRAGADQPGLPASRDLLRTIDRRVYSPANRGLRTLRAVLHEAGTEARFPELGRGARRLVLYWKFPDRRRARFETPSGAPVPPTTLDFLLPDGINMLAFAVPKPFSMRRVTVLSAPPVSDPFQFRVRPDPWDPVQEERIYVFNEARLPVQSRTAAPGMFSHTDTMEYELRPEGALLRTLTVASRTDMGSSTAVLRLQYTRVGGFWLPWKILGEQNGQRSTYTLTQYQLNRNLDDRIFAGQ